VKGVGIWHIHALHCDSHSTARHISNPIQSLLFIEALHEHDFNILCIEYKQLPTRFGSNNGTWLAYMFIKPNQHHSKSEKM
jgi:hypothetical protein